MWGEGHQRRRLHATTAQARRPRLQAHQGQHERRLPQKDHPLAATGWNDLDVMPGRLVRSSTPTMVSSRLGTSRSNTSAGTSHSSRSSRSTEEHLSRGRGASEAHKRTPQTHPHLYAYQLGLYEERSTRASPIKRKAQPKKPKSFSWDMVRRVTGIYEDSFAAL
jgi:hypothetical protein